MKNYIIALLFLLPLSIHAQIKEQVKIALDNYQYEKVLELSQGSSDAQVVANRIEALKALGRYSQLMNEISPLFAADTTNLSYCINIAECQRTLGNNHKAAIYYKIASQLQPDNNYFKIQNIKALIAAEENDAAVDACHRYIDADSVSSVGYKYMGIAYENKQDVANAFYSFNIAYRRNSTDSQIIYHIAKILNGNKQFADAIDVTEKYRDADTTNIDVNRQNAMAYCLNGDYKKAIERYESLKRAGDNSASTLYYLGVAYYGDNWFYGAYDNFNLAIKKNPSDVNVLYYLAKSCARTSWKKEGVEYMKKAMEITVPSDSTLLWLYKGLADCCSYAGNRELRIETLKQIYSLNHDYNVFYSIAGSYYLSKEYQKALANYEKFISLLPVSLKKVNKEGESETKYQFAMKRIKEIKSENFFKGDDAKSLPAKNSKKIYYEYSN